MAKANILCVFVFVCMFQTVFCQFGFFPERQSRQNGLFGQNIGRRFRDRIQGFFTPTTRPNFINTEPTYIYPQYPVYEDGGQNFGRPVVFPTNRPQNTENPFNNNQNNGQNEVHFNDNPPNNENPSRDGENTMVFPQGDNGGNGGNNEQNMATPDGDNNGGFVNKHGEVNSADEKNNGNTASGEHDAVNFDNDPPPVTTQPTTTLPPLTPVPDLPNTESRNGFNFNDGSGFSASCQTVDGGLGSCISVLQCQAYVGLIQESRTNPAAVQVLRRAHCGFEGNTPKVCCPRPGIPVTPPPTTTSSTTTTTTTTTPPPVPSGKSADTDYVAALPEPPVCGSTNASFSRVVGGTPAKLGDFPWMTMLGYQNARLGTTSWLCGGSLISERHVLTAAHCIHNHENDLYVIRVGELDYAREDDGATPVDVLIKRKIKHEQYDPKAYTDDIGILVLQNDVQYTALIRPICIPKEPELRANTFEDYTPMIAGWGHTAFRGPVATHLQVLQIPVVGSDYCKQKYSAYKSQHIDERVLCAGYKNGGKDACQGDSGGPLMQPIWSRQTLKTYFYQIGVVSYGKKCAEPDFPGVYSRVTNFVPWIMEQVLGHQR